MLSSSLFSQSTLEAHPFRPYDDQWHGKDWTDHSYQDSWDATWSEGRYNGDDLPSLMESVAGLLARVRSSFQPR
jgi:hypothetical protein